MTTAGAAASEGEAAQSHQPRAGTGRATRAAGRLGRVREGERKARDSAPPALSAIGMPSAHASAAALRCPHSLPLSARRARPAAATAARCSRNHRQLPHRDVRRWCHNALATASHCPLTTHTATAGWCRSDQAAACLPACLPANHQPQNPGLRAAQIASQIGRAAPHRTAHARRRTAAATPGHARPCRGFRAKQSHACRWVSQSATTTKAHGHRARMH